MQQLNIKITPQTPIVLTAEGSSAILTESADYIAGSIVRGVLATRYIENRQLGSEAHLDAEFRRLFSGALAFTPGYLEAGTAGRGFPVPLSVQRDKIDRSKLMDLITHSPEQGYKSMSGTVAIMPGEGRTIATAAAPKKISLHMSRSTARERISGRSEEGGIFNYESVLPGASFIAAAIGERADIEALTAGLGLADGALTSYIGRSKSTQYGRVLIELLDTADVDSTIPAGDSVWLRLDSDLLGYELGASAIEVLGELFIALADELGTDPAALQEHISLGRIFARATSVDSMVGVWQMRRHTYYGLQAGSIFELRKDAPFSPEERAALARIMLAGIGARTSEGYGQLRVWQVGPISLANSSARVATVKPKAEERAAKIVRRILLRRVLERVSSRAYSDAGSIAGSLRGKTHALVRLENLLTGLARDKKLAESFRQAFRAELRSQSAFERNLQALRLRGIGLNKILDGTESAYRLADFAAEVPEKLAREVGFSIEDYDHEVCYTYYLWLFRHARKRAGEKEASEDE